MLKRKASVTAAMKKRMAGFTYVRNIDRKSDLVHTILAVSPL